MKYTLGGRVFATKKAIKSYFQDYYRSNDVGTALEGEYKAVMADLIRRHPLYDATWSTDFTIGLDDWGHKNFKSGDYTFSYNTCIEGQSLFKNQKKNVQNSARAAIESQIHKHRHKSRIAGMYLCDVCSGTFLKVDVDHNFTIITFQTLLDNFMIAQCRGYADFEILSTDSGDLFNEVDRKQWCEYHAKYAALRCLCRNCHQFKKKKSNIKDTYNSIFNLT